MSNKPEYAYLPFVNVKTLNDCMEIEFDEKARLKEGWIYVLSNPSMPGIVKIGMTTISPELRCKELSSSTGVPTPFVLQKAFHVDKPREVEKYIHQKLSLFRISDRREFFEVAVSAVADVLVEFGVLEHGNCKIDLLLGNNAVPMNSLTGPKVGAKISAEVFDEISLGDFDVNSFVDMAARFVLQNLHCGLVYKSGQFYAFPSAEYTGHGEKCPDFEKPKFIDTKISASLELAKAEI